MPLWRGRLVRSKAAIVETVIKAAIPDARGGLEAIADSRIPLTRETGLQEIDFDPAPVMGDIAVLIRNRDIANRRP